MARLGESSSQGLDQRTYSLFSPLNSSEITGSCQPTEPLLINSPLVSHHRSPGREVVITSPVTLSVLEMWLKGSSAKTTAHRG